MIRYNLFERKYEPAQQKRTAESTVLSCNMSPEVLSQIIRHIGHLRAHPSA